MTPARFVEVSTSQELSPFLEAWERLSENPLERNVFAEPWLVLPALEHFAPGDDARIGLVTDERSNEILGVFPFVRAPTWNRLPVHVVRGWIHEQCYLGTPLLHADPVRAKHAIVRFMEGSSSAPLVEFDDVSGDGEFMRLLTEVIGERSLDWSITHSVTRPVLRRRESADGYLASALDGDARRKLRSKEKGLAALGPLHTEVVDGQSELEAWIAHFVRLEEASWKGRLGTAFGVRPASRRYFESILREGLRRGRLQALTLYAGDRPAALKVNLKSGDEWFAYKITYDDELARFSPGLQLEVENIRRFHSLDGAVSMDSCTGPTTRVFRELWLERRGIQNLVVATGSERGRLALAAMPLLLWSKRRAETLVPKLQGSRVRRPSPRQVACLPLATTVTLPKRIAASPIALAATLPGRAGRGSIRSALRHAVRFQCARMVTADFHDELDVFFSELDLAELLSAVNYEAIRPELVDAAGPSVIRRVGRRCALGALVRIAAPLSIRLDFERLRAGEQIPPHGHSRVVSGFSVVEGSVALRRYDLVESMPDRVTVRPTFEGRLVQGQASTESDVRDNVHWIVALEDSVLFRLTVSDVPARSPVPTSLNVWVDPRAPVRGDGTILGRWIAEEAARKIPAFAVH